MFISIVIATYNSSETLGECLNSLLCQTYENFEVIIKDGGSLDNTIMIAEEYSFKMNMKIVSESDLGVYDAWNKAIEMCSGDWVTFLGSDDYLKNEDSLKSLMPVLKEAKTKSVHLVYGNNDIITINGEYKNTVGDSWDYSKSMIYRQMSIRHPGAFCTMELVKRLNGFDSTFKIAGDYDFVIRALKYTDFIYYPFTVVVHRMGGLSISPKRSMDIILESVKLREKNELKPRYLFDALMLKRLILYALSLFLSDEKILRLLRR